MNILNTLILLSLACATHTSNPATAINLSKQEWNVLDFMQGRPLARDFAYTQLNSQERAIFDNISPAPLAQAVITTYAQHAHAYLATYCHMNPAYTAQRYANALIKLTYIEKHNITIEPKNEASARWLAFRKVLATQQGPIQITENDHLLISTWGDEYAKSLIKIGLASPQDYKLTVAHFVQRTKKLLRENAQDQSVGPKTH